MQKGWRMFREFYSGSPEYFSTKLDDLKVEMLAKATENAKLRAENMVKATGNRIGFMRSAKMGGPDYADQLH